MKKLTLLTSALCMIAAAPSFAQGFSEITNLDWSGRANFGGFVTDGNTDKKAVVLDGRAEARGAVNRYTAGAEVGYAEDEGVETENDYMAYAEYDRFLSEKMFTGGRLSYEADKIVDLDSRVQVGPYLGYQFHESDPLNLSSRIGFNYFTEEFGTGDNDDGIGASWGVDYDQKVLQDAVQVFYKHDLLLPVSDTDGFLFDSEAGVRFPVANFLTGTAQVDFDWDNDPVAGSKEDDTKYSLKLGYEF